MYYLQSLHVADLMWHRDPELPACSTALGALEARDEIKGNWQNDGVRRGVRVVDDEGRIIEYTRD